MKKRLLACLLTAAMLVSLFPLPALAAEAERPEWMVTAFDPLDGDTAAQTVPQGGEPVLPDSLTAWAYVIEDDTAIIPPPEGLKQEPNIQPVTIPGVTWEAQPEFDPDTPGEYVYTPVLPAAYEVAGEVELPAITVTVGAAREPEQTAVERVQALIDALPDPEGITLDNAEDTAAQIWDIDEASETLTEEEWAALDFTRYEAVMLALAALMDDTPTLLAGENGIKYLDWDDSQKKLVEKTYTGSVTVVDSTTTTWTDGWYVVNSGNAENPLKIDSLITVTGNVHLILTDGCTLNAETGISISEEGSNRLTIYAQSDNADMGALTATGGAWSAGIQCGTGQVLTINGGNITAAGDDRGAGIDNGTGGTITINGGSVTAKGGWGYAGIECSTGQALTINGGKVTATGDGNGAGIGGCSNGAGGTITINGGSVTTKGGSNGAGIGGGNRGAGGNITINGGNVTANGSTGIGGGWGNSGGEITISGGNVTAEGITGAGIGGGSGEDGGTIVIRGEATYVRAESTYGAGIGGGRASSISGAGGNITIEGGTVIATGGQSSAGIGGAGGLIGGGGDHPAGNGGTITITGGKVTATGNNAPDIGGGNGSTGIAPADKIEIGPDADVKNGSGGKPNYGPTHGEDTSKWDSDDSQHWHPCGISGCPDTSHQSKKEAHSFGDWVTDEYDHWKECEICNRKTDETSHTYNQETVKQEALKSAADCESPATYYKSCVCGKVSTNNSDTFTYGSALTHTLTHHAAVAATCTQTGNKEYWSCSLCNKNFSDSGGTTEIDDVTTPREPHNWSADWSNDGDSHWHECTVCGEKNDLAAHIGDAEVCNAPQTCTVCGYKMTDTLNHNWGGWVSNGNGTHTRTCQRDPSHTETGDCSGGTATCSAQAICSACGKPYGSTDSGNHTGGTEIRDKKDATTSAEGYTGDTYCLGCGEKIAVGTTIPKLNGGGGGGTYTPPTTPTYPPTVERPSGGGGTPSTSPSNPKQGDTVTVKPKPDDGFEVDNITITDKNGKPVEVTKNPDGTYTFKQPNGKVKIEVSYKAVEKPWNNPFSDVSEGDWYYEAVRFVQENGLMNGYSDGRFGANDTLSRAQLAQILFNKEGRPGVNYLLDFSDVAGEAWYTEAIRWATSQGIVSGYGNGTFGPNDPITREQLAVMLWRYSGSPAATNKELHFNDTDEISPFALEALRWAVENGILNGYGDGRLGPQGQATRAQTAQMLKNFIENQEENA